MKKLLKEALFFITEIWTTYILAWLPVSCRISRSIDHSVAERMVGRQLSCKLQRRGGSGSGDVYTYSCVRNSQEHRDEIAGGERGRVCFFFKKRSLPGSANGWLVILRVLASLTIECETQRRFGVRERPRKEKRKREGSMTVLGLTAYWSALLAKSHVYRNVMVLVYYKARAANVWSWQPHYQCTNVLSRGPRTKFGEYCELPCVRLWVRAHPLTVIGRKNTTMYEKKVRRTFFAIP